MPLYVYEIIQPDGSPGPRFEVLQGMNDPELIRHPETNEPVRRLIQAPNVAGKWSDTKAKSRLSDKNLGELGFTKYVKTDTGKYEKTVGKGPRKLSAD